MYLQNYAFSHVQHLVPLGSNKNFGQSLAWAMITEIQGPNEIVRLQVIRRELGLTASLPDPAHISLPGGGKQLPSASLPTGDSTDLEWTIASPDSRSQLSS